MGRQRPRLRGVQALSLIFCLQVQQTIAVPLAGPYTSTDILMDADCSQTGQMPPATSVDPAPSPTTSWQPTAYEIGDGQVQAPDVIAIMESLELEAATRSHEHKARPRKRTTSSAPAILSTSTSTTTIFTTIPNASLASLTTSEVQTITAPLPSNTTGVS